MTASTRLGHVKGEFFQWLVLFCLFDLFLPFTPTEIILASVVVFFRNDGRCFCTSEYEVST